MDAGPTNRYRMSRASRDRGLHNAIYRIGESIWRFHLILLVPAAAAIYLDWQIQCQWQHKFSLFCHVQDELHDHYPLKLPFTGLSLHDRRMR